MDRELRLQYLMLEDSYRKLEKRVTELETNIKLRNLLGVKEKLENTSISLFLLRKDREKLAKDLGLDMEDYTSVKSFGEEALETLIYECSDVLSGLSEGLKSEFSPVILDVSANTKNVSKEEEKEAVKAPVKKRTRRTKAEMQALREAENNKNGTELKAADKVEAVTVDTVKDTELKSIDKVEAVTVDTVKDTELKSIDKVEAVTVESVKDTELKSIDKAEAVAVESVKDTESQATKDSTKEIVVQETVKNASSSDISHLNTQEVATKEFKDMDAVLSMWG